MSKEEDKEEEEDGKGMLGKRKDGSKEEVSERERGRKGG